jgi:predicted DNA-binding transcriptional regulator AlpA
VRYVTARQIAAVCGVVPKTIHRWAASGAIPKPVRGPGGTGWARWDVEALVPALRAAGYALPEGWPAPEAAAA